MATLEEHIKEINAWVKEACAENPEENEIEIQGDVVTSYISSQIGSENIWMARAIRRRYGL